MPDEYGHYKTTAQNDYAARRVRRCIEILGAYENVIRLNMGHPFELVIAELENLTSRIKDNCI